MAYSDDESRLIAMLPYMNDLAKGLDCEWTVTKGNANTVAFRIRESLRLARIYSETYPDLARFAGDYAVNVLRGNKIRARRRTPSIIVSEVMLPVILQPERPISYQNVDVYEAGLQREIGAKIAEAQHNRQEGMKELSGKQSAEGIADIYRRVGASKPTLRFPNAALSQADLVALFRWASHHEPTLMIMHADPAVTVSLFDPIVAEFSWKPDADYEELES